MATEYKTFSLGANEEGQRRKKAYEEASKKAGRNYAEWIREVLDKAAGFKPK